ncbi:peptide-methionine (S)-S-oxide reductase MsrA [Urechidicola croceus]|uniref:Peptide methionine sulfoxide reductase MsrA n=1 Tax=Urechidicola croceus TaxID=1850246 RepID=A0A1D8P4H8_9FLAO|nr:peptide-methionine (S)-S-oxide reductase MsrA [Urechidicola croceus]AOW19456.1 peptide-methionine (S)-S-oxide reductase [Urechidicola croceus]
MKSISIIVLSLILFSCTSQAQKQEKVTKKDSKKMMGENLEYATFGGGCFWCTEAVFEQLEGVTSVKSGYSGGQIKDPTYREISTGRTGHAEVIQIGFDPTIIKFEELLDVFFNTHNPTTLNRQGADRGTQYRSAVFYHNEKQKSAVNKMIEALDNAKVFADKIVTEVTEFDVFYEAEKYHQNYYENNKSQGYCQVVINPKLEKLQKQYKDKLKK